MSTDISVKDFNKSDSYYLNYLQSLGKQAILKIKNIEQETVLQYLLLLTITVVAATLRFYKLGQWSFWIDEIYTLERTTQDISIISWPSISSLLIKGVLASFEINEWFARLAPTTIGILSIPIIYVPIKRIFGVTVALTASFLLAISPWHIFWSQNARFYTVLLLFYTLGLLYFYICFEEDSLLYGLLGTVFMTLAVRERLIALFFIPIIISYILSLKLLKFKQPPGLRIKNLLVIILPLFIYGLFDISKMLFGETVASFDQAKETVNPSAINVFFVAFLGNPHVSPFWLLGTIVNSIGISLICIGTIGGIYLILHKERSGLFVYLGAIIPLLAITALSMIAYTQDRYIFVSLSSWIILGSIVLCELLSRTQGSAKIISLSFCFVIAASLLMQNGLYFKYQNGGRHDWNGAYSFIQQAKMEGDIIVSPQSELGTYYLPDQQIVEMNMVTIESIEKSNNRVWFIDIGWIDPKLQSWLTQNSELVAVRDVQTTLGNLVMRIYLYTPSNFEQDTVSVRKASLTEPK